MHRRAILASAAALVFALVLTAASRSPGASGGGSPPPEEAKSKPKTKSSRKGELQSLVELDDLIQYNAKALFGTESVKIDGDRVTILLNKDGHLYGAFEGKNLMDSTHPDLTGANRRFVREARKDGGRGGKRGGPPAGKEEDEKILPGLAGIALGAGSWISKFQLAGGIRVKFDMRVPNILTRQSSVTLITNYKGRPTLATPFFNAIVKNPGSTYPTPIRDYRSHASNWFPRKGEAIPIDFGIDDEQCVVRFDGKDIVSCPVEPREDKGGRIAIQFNKVVFTLQNLEISGQLDRDWARKQLAELEAAGDLREDPPPKPEETPEGGEDGRPRRPGGEGRPGRPGGEGRPGRPGGEPPPEPPDDDDEL
ncbi:MAG: hypothetical protein JXA90_10640 [Planctomycetes bacterium]|nr:hypothetical protein [Planctomycetota bacterium]